jgi:5-methylcytosine-specific restriction endonuclease McrA
MQEKRCSRCNEIKPVSEFGKDRRNKDGLLIYCKSCKRKINASQSEYRKEYMKRYLVTYQKSPEYRERERKYAQEYRKLHPDKNAEYSAKYRATMKEQGGRITDEDIRECLEFFNYECAYSGVPLGTEYQTDHVTPISKGGTNTVHNVVPCLPVINLRKSSKDLDTWYPKQSFYSESRHNKIKEWMKKGED